METKSPYTVSEDDAAIMARLLEVFTPGQLLKLTEKMKQVIAGRFGSLEVRVKNDRMFMELKDSDDCGKVVRKD